MLSFDDCVYVDKKVDESLQVKCDDVIMCVRNGSKNLVGKTALIPPNMPMTTWGAFMMIIRSKLNDTYIFHYLNSQMFFSQVFKCQRREKNNVKRREEIDANAGIKNAGIPTAGCKPPVNCLPESRPGAR